MPKLSTQKNNRLALGIDPGKEGGMVLFFSRDNFQITKTGKYTEQDLFNLLRELNGQMTSDVVTVFIERVWARPGNGTKQSYNYGYNYGTIRMACIAAGVRLEEVLPSKWQRGLGIPPAKKNDSYADRKKRLKAKAQELFPQVKVTNWMADALLIGEYGRRELLRGL